MSRAMRQISEGKFARLSIRYYRIKAYPIKRICKTDCCVNLHYYVLSDNFFAAIQFILKNILVQQLCSGFSTCLHHIIQVIYQK